MTDVFYNLKAAEKILLKGIICMSKISFILNQYFFSTHTTYISTSRIYKKKIDRKKKEKSCIQ